MPKKTTGKVPEVVAHQNGKGPVEEGEPVFTFSTGKQVRLRPVSIFAAGKVEDGYTAAHPKPEPPLEEVDTPDGRKPLPNEYDDTYRKRLDEWNQGIAEARRRFVIRRGVVADIDDAQLDAVLEDMRACGAAEFEDMTRLEQWVIFVCVGKPAEYPILEARLLGLSEASEAAIQSAADRFQGPVPGT